MATLIAAALPLPRVGFLGHESAGEITRLLRGWRNGDLKALDALLPVVHNELQRLAHFQAICRARTASILLGFMRVTPLVSSCDKHDSSSTGTFQTVRALLGWAGS